MKKKLACAIRADLNSLLGEGRNSRTAGKVLAEILGQIGHRGEICNLALIDPTQDLHGPELFLTHSRQKFDKGVWAQVFKINTLIIFWYFIQGVQPVQHNL